MARAVYLIPKKKAEVCSDRLQDDVSLVISGCYSNRDQESEPVFDK